MKNAYEIAEENCAKSCVSWLAWPMSGKKPMARASRPCFLRQPQSLALRSSEPVLADDLNDYIEEEEEC